MGSVVPWYDSLVSVITLTLYTVGVESIDSMDTTLVHLVVSGVCVTTHQTRVRWSIPIWTTCWQDHNLITINVKYGSLH